MCWETVWAKTSLLKRKMTRRIKEMTWLLPFLPSCSHKSPERLLRLFWGMQRQEQTFLASGKVEQGHFFHHSSNTQQDMSSLTCTENRGRSLPSWCLQMLLMSTIAVVGFWRQTPHLQYLVLMLSLAKAFLSPWLLWSLGIRSVKDKFPTYLCWEKSLCFQ